MIELPKLIIFDFDNVVYKHEPNSHKRILAIANETAGAYFDVPAIASEQNHIRCWREHRNGFLYLLKDEIHYTDKKGHSQIFENPIREAFRERQYLMAHHAFERVCRNDVHGIVTPKVPRLIKNLSKQTQ